MHIPDGLLDVKTCTVTYLAAGGTLAYGLRYLKAEFKESQIPLYGLLGAFIFAAQMINLPIALGTSGHLLGGVLAMLVVGPWASAVIITSILIVQSIFFMDGGLLALGANVLNMAIIGVFIGYVIYKFLNKINSAYQVNIFIAAFFSTLTAAVLAAVELAISGIIDLKLILPMIASWHVLIGMIEGIITVLVIVYLRKVVPEKLYFLKDEGGKGHAK